MIFSFTGAQSTGKTTLLNKMRSDPDFKDWAFEVEITRSLREKYNLDINEQGSVTTQLIVLNSHLENVLKHAKSGRHVMLDRCILDGFVYTTYCIGKQDDKEFIRNRWIVDYYGMELLNIIWPKYTGVFQTDHESVPIENDGVRSTDTKFRNTIIALFDCAINDLIKPFMGHVPVKLSGSVDQRYDLLKSTIKQFTT